MARDERLYLFHIGHLTYLIYSDDTTISYLCCFQNVIETHDAIKHVYKFIFSHLTTFVPHRLVASLTGITQYQHFWQRLCICDLCIRNMH